MSDSLTSAELLANAEQFSPYWPDFIPRQGQQQMAQWIEEAIAQRQSLVVEAPSGAGKTLAYLIPILRQGQRAIISTASRYLQQQLYRHDIPVLQKVLATDQSVALLQGRSHYLCPYYLDKNLHAGDIKDTEQIAQLTQLSNRFRQTGQGEWDKLLPNASSRTRALASSGSDDCLGQQCPQYTNCPLMKARLRAQKADVVVVNHSLLFSDRSLRRDQWADRLPATDVIIIDEAHRLTDFAQTIVGQRVSSYKLRGLITDTEQAIGRYASEQRGLLRYIKQVGTVLLKLPQRLPSSVYYQRPQHLAVVEQCLQMLRTLNRALQKLEQREYSLVELVLRYQRMIECLQQIRAATGLCWVRAYQNGFVIHNIPVSLAALMQELMSEVKGSWIMTSATLSIEGKADRFLSSVGVTGSQFKRVEDERDLSGRVVLYTPPITVAPSDDDFYRQYCEYLLPLAQLSQGRVLCLFSSYRALSAAAEALKAKQLVDQSTIVLLIQSEKSTRSQAGQDNYRLVEQFKQQSSVILLGVGSFWEGLDLSGIPIAAVVIDKLPFAKPEDPLVSMRAAELAHFGVDSFEHYLLPEAIIRWRQGCGRLLRRASDRGVIMITDPRLQTKSYGAVFKNSLPPMPQLSDWQQVEEFIQNQSE